MMKKMSKILPLILCFALGFYFGAQQNPMKDEGYFYDQHAPIQRDTVYLPSKDSIKVIVPKIIIHDNAVDIDEELSNH